jgi:hypothetical protein
VSDVAALSLAVALLGVVLAGAVATSRVSAAWHAAARG